MLDNSRIAHTVPDACLVSGLSRSTLYRFIQSKDLPVRKCGNRTLILHEDLKRFIESLPAQAA
jgi:excisionase family DNA binding protein